MRPWEILGPDPEFQTILETASSGILPGGAKLSSEEITGMLDHYRDKYVITDEEYRWLKLQRTFKEG